MFHSILVENKKNSEKRQTTLLVEIFLNILIYDQSRYTFCYNNIIKYITNSINTEKYTIYSDLPGCQTKDGGTIPSHLTITPLRPDRVIMDQNTVNIFELTVPFETNLPKRHRQKMDNYSHFLTDIVKLTPKLGAFEVEPRGIITRENKDKLKKDIQVHQQV